MLTGPDSGAVRAHLAVLADRAGVPLREVERFDLSDDAGRSLLDTARTVPMFATARVLVGSPVTDLAPDVAAELVGAAGDDVVVLTGAGAPPATLRRALDGAEFTSFALPTFRDAQARVTALAAEHQVRLPADVLDVLVDAAPSGWAQVRSAVAQLADLPPEQAIDVDVVRALLGSSGATLTPWALAAHIEAGQVGRALFTASALEPVGTVAYLGKRAVQVAAAAEQLANGDGQPHTGRGVLRSARNAGVGGAWLALDLVAAADREVKTGPDARGVLDVLTVHLTRLWGASGRT